MKDADSLLAKRELPTDQLITHERSQMELPLSGMNVFRKESMSEAKQRDKIRRHKQWLETIPHEYPMPYTPYRIGVYIRYFNQTKYENYLDYHKKEFTDTIGRCYVELYIRLIM